MRLGLVGGSVYTARFAKFLWVGCMELFIEFLAQQWILVGALLACVFLLMFHESRRAGQAISPLQLSKVVNAEGALVVDLRDSGEFRAGHIVDAINIPFNKVNDRLGELEKYREKPLILVCKMGTHSSSVGKNLAGKGFSQVYRLGGGMTEWHAMQLPVVKG